MTLNTVSNVDSATRVEQVMETIRRRIATRALQPGARLPSIRKGAETMGVSASTMVEAYDRLAAEGLIRSRPGAGFYVCAPQAPLVLADLAPRLDRAVDPFWVSRQSLEAGETVLKPGCGWLPQSWMPEEDLRRGLRNIARSDGDALTEYGPPLGLPPLRQILSRRMTEHSVEIAPDNIMLTASGTQAIDLICRFFLEPGDTVLVDDPCYFNFLALLRAHRVKIIGIPFTPAGSDLQRFEAALQEHKPRLYLTNSALHNPTGAALSPVAAHKLLKLAAQSQLIIVEDDIFTDFEHEPAPRLAAFDGFERVIHIGSFSKTISASARVGYIAARPDWIDGLIDLKIASNFSGPALSAHLVHSVLTDGSYRRHLNSLKSRLANAMSETVRRLEPLGIRPWIEPRGGMFLWCTLPKGMDAAAVARRALTENVVLAPGNVFSVSQSATGFMRFNAAQSTDPRLFTVLKSAVEM